MVSDASCSNQLSQFFFALRTQNDNYVAISLVSEGKFPCQTFSKSSLSLFHLCHKSSTQSGWHKTQQRNAHITPVGVYIRLPLSLWSWKRNFRITLEAGHLLHNFQRIDVAIMLPKEAIDQEKAFPTRSGLHDKFCAGLLKSWCWKWLVAIPLLIFFLRCPIHHREETENEESWPRTSVKFSTRGHAISWIFASGFANAFGNTCKSRMPFLHVVWSLCRCATTPIPNVQEIDPRSAELQRFSRKRGGGVGGKKAKRTQRSRNSAWNFPMSLEIAVRKLMTCYGAAVGGTEPVAHNFSLFYQRTGTRCCAGFAFWTRDPLVEVNDVSLTQRRIQCWSHTFGTAGFFFFKLICENETKSKLKSKDMRFALLWKKENKGFPFLSVSLFWQKQQRQFVFLR